MPAIVFNATTVNTGNPFRFSAQAHGEQPDARASSLSRRPRLTWLDYEALDAGAFNPSPYALSRVVAASASVPGIFPPILFSRVGQDLALAIADGGVVDNQGTDSLLASRCADITVSDASGQLRYTAYPDVNGMVMLGRSTDILMERIRELNFARLVDANRSGAIRELTYLHLTKELWTPPPISKLSLDNFALNYVHEYAERDVTTYGINWRAQSLLSTLRTDLDCFAEIEIKSLMLSGYSQARSADLARGRERSTGAPHTWEFAAAKTLIGTGFKPTGVAGIYLSVGRQRFFRLPQIVRLIMQRSRSVVWGTCVLCMVVIAACLLSFGSFLFAALRDFWSSWIVAILVWAMGLVIISAKVPPSWLKRLVVKLLSAPLLVLAMMFAWAVLLIADPIYLHWGRLADTSRGHARQGTRESS